MSNRAVRVLAAALVLAGAAALSGCSSSYMVIDAMPSAVGGLPEHTPERPATPPAYPAVHDMPPGRSDVPLTDAEKKKLREELAATRERAARQAANPDGSGATPASGNARNP